MKGFAVAASLVLLAGTAAPAPAASSSLRAAAPDVPCQVLPADNVWNMDVSSLPVHPKSKTWKRSAHAGSTLLHPDFGGPYGIPYDVVDDTHPTVAVDFTYADESDDEPYPFGPDIHVEGGSDRHALMVNADTCTLYELYDAHWHAGNPDAGSGAVFDLGSDELRPAGWTSADAAGLPILPGLVRYDDVLRGAIKHAIRFTAPATCNGYIYPARHKAGSGSCATRPPMGLRVRLKSTVDISKYGSQARIVLTALKRYGMILADNGSPWYITGAPSSKWNDDELHTLGGIKGSDFEVVDTTGFVNG